MASLLPDPFRPSWATERERDITISRNFLVAMLRQVGGCVTLDEHDMQADLRDVSVEFVTHEFPRRWTIQLQEDS